MEKAQAMADISLYLRLSHLSPKRLSPQPLLSWACLHFLAYLHVCNFTEFGQKGISNRLSNLDETRHNIQSHTGGRAHLRCRSGFGGSLKTPPAVQHLHCCKPEEQLHPTSTAPGALRRDPTERSTVLANPVP